MGTTLDSFAGFIDAYLEKSLEFCQNVPAFVFALLIPIGLAYLFFGLKIYKFVLGVTAFVLAGTLTWYLSNNVVLGVVVGGTAAVVSLLLQFIFMIVTAGLTFGAVAFASIVVYLRSDLSLLLGIVTAALGMYAAVKVFRLIIVLTTSAIGSAAVIFALLVLKEHGGIRGFVDMTSFIVDEFQMAVGFAGFLLVGAIIQGIAWGGRQTTEDD